MPPAPKGCGVRSNRQPRSGLQFCIPIKEVHPAVVQVIGGKLAPHVAQFLGAGLARRLRRVDYPYAMAVENLAAGQRSVAEVVTGWATSPEHRANLLSLDARQVGFGVARAGDGWLHWVMIGAARR